MQERETVFPFSIARLLDELSFYADSSTMAVRMKGHASYFNHYFTELDAKTVVVEPLYVDHDYLEDYTAYYARCFHPYGRHCTRFHFFSTKFDHAEFKELVSGNLPEKQALAIQSGYIGFIVVRPLPETMIGRTCLRTYEEEDKRNYPITRDYRVNIHGIELNINTLAYQEQDGVLSRCATTAVWSALQGTGIIFQHHIPSPAEVTVAANKLSPSEGRSIPSDGLNMLQMANAIRQFDLEPLFIRPSNPDIFKASVYAYLKFGIPAILGVSVYDDPKSGTADFHDLHAVTVTGYSLPDGPCRQIGDSRLNLSSLRIDKLYAHDDQIGPFARLVFSEEPLFDAEVRDTENQLVPLLALDTSVETKQGEGRIAYSPPSLLVPVYHKIRVPFSAILERILLVNDTLSVINEALYLFEGKDIEWDLFLSDNNGLKIDIRKPSTKLLKERRLKLLVSGLPRYIWRAIATVEKERVLEIWFDATDLEQGQFFKEAFIYESTYKSNLEAVVQDPIIESIASSEKDEAIWSHLRNSV